MMEPNGHTVKEIVDVLLADVSPVADTQDSSLGRPGCGVLRSAQCPGETVFNSLNMGLTCPI